MPPKNNNVHHDTDGDFALRAETCAVGIATLYLDLSFTEAQRDEIVAFAPAFRHALYVQTEEKADIDEVYVNLDNAETALRKQYVACQTHIKGEMLFLDDGTVEHLHELYDVNGDLPDGRGNMIKVVNIMIEGWDLMGVELPAVTLIASLFEDLRTGRDNINALLETVPVELRESRLATYDKNQLRAQGELLLRRVFHRAVALWGDEDNRLLDLGFVPKSMIWTPGEGESGWPKKPVGKMSIAPVPMTGILAGCEEYTGTVRFDLRIAWAKKNEPVPDMPSVDTYTDVEQPVLLDSDGFPLQKNFVYYVWIRARKDGEVSDWSDVVGIEWTEESIPK